jgi:hypothetical protein
MFGCLRSFVIIKTTKLKYMLYHGELAQLGERLLCTQEVIGSIPLFSTMTKPNPSS